MNKTTSNSRFMSYEFTTSAFGALNIVWRATEKGPKVHRVFLPSEKTSAKDIAQRTFVDLRSEACPAIRELGERIQGFLSGEAVDFKLDTVALENCSLFQKRVVLAQHNIPSGWISTYKRIAKYLGTPNGARAVGNALAHNPFPIIIPCHRTIKANGEPGGFQGGKEMKQALLQLEGVELSQTEKVVTNRIYY